MRTLSAGSRTNYSFGYWPGGSIVQGGAYLSFADWRCLDVTKKTIAGLADDWIYADITLMRPDDGHSRAKGTMSWLPWPVALDECVVADGHSGNVSDAELCPSCHDCM